MSWLILTQTQLDLANMNMPWPNRNCKSNCKTFMSKLYILNHRIKGSSKIGSSSGWLTFEQFLLKNKITCFNGKLPSINYTDNHWKQATSHSITNYYQYSLKQLWLSYIWNITHIIKGSNIIGRFLFLCKSD